MKNILRASYVSNQNVYVDDGLWPNFTQLENEKGTEKGRLPKIAQIEKKMLNWKKSIL